MFVDVLLLLSLLVVGPAQDARQAADRILRHERYQTELPGQGGRRFADGEAWEKDSNSRRRPEGRGDGGPVRDPYLSGRGTSGESGLGVLLWLLAAVVAVVIVLWAIGSVRLYHRDVELPVAPQPPPPEVTLTTAPLEEAEKLAADGRFGEAIRALLHLTLDSLRGILPTDSSLTSREILRRSRLPAASRDLLEHLVAAVERSLFARRPVHQADYDSCVSEYRELLATVAEERS